MPASSKHKYSKTLAFPDTYYGLIINLLQSVELFCAYRRIILRLPSNYFALTPQKLGQTMSALILPSLIYQISSIT